MKLSDRQTLIENFLNKSDWRSAKRRDLAGDASNRRYERLFRPDGSTAVLMDAPPEKGEDIRPFVKIAEHLQNQGLSAPKIFCADPKNGFLLLEDLGDDLFARVVAKSPSTESELYKAAVDSLLDLHNAPLPRDVAEYSAPIMAKMSALAWRWYLRGCGNENEGKAQRFETIFEPILAQNAPSQGVLIQRDFHAENLVWLPDRLGSARMGLLDFQDALIGHKAYDLVSLLQDARRDVSPTTEAQMVQRYITKSGVGAESFEAAYHVLAAQRNLRIIGVFARLCMHYGKAQYVDLIPRVWGLLERDLEHPALASIDMLVKSDLPKPNPDILIRLKEKCATIQTL